MQLLLLGGYRFLGRAVIHAAQARGHAVAAFNRGHLDPMAGVEQITGDRDDVAPLGDRRWDVVVDTSGYIPRHVAASAACLSDRVERYIFISSLSVYPDPLPAGVREDAPLQTLPAGADPDDNGVMDTYGARKALCEAAAEAAMPGRVIAVRAGFIVGPYDPSERFTSWVERAARREPIVVPGDEKTPVQLIDVRDLAEWIVAAAEQRLSGAYNATGPAGPLTLAEMAIACLDGVGSPARPVAIPSERLKRLGEEPWVNLTFWLDPPDYGLMQADIAKATRDGLRFRPLRDTVRDTWAWAQNSPHERRVQLSAERERTLIERSAREARD